MTKTGTIVKAMQAVLLLTVLTPAAVYAGPLTTRPAQAQDQPAKGRINRGLILGTAEAATNPNAQHPVEIPAISAPAATAPAEIAKVEAPQVEIPALPPRKDDVPAAPTTDNSFSTAGAPAASTSVAQTSSVVTLPAPAIDTPAPVTTSAPTTTDAVTAPAPVAPVAPVTTAVQTPMPATTPTTTAKVDAATSSANTSSTKTVQASHQSRSRHHSDDSFDVGGFNVSSANINHQLTKFINRRDVKSILAQFGLN